MPDTPLNPDGLRAAEELMILTDRITKINYLDAERIISAYLAVAQPVVNRNKAMAWFEGFEAGWDEAKDPGAFVNNAWDAKTPNPYVDKDESNGR